MPRHVCVEQHSEEHCGDACIATVAVHHGKRLPLARIRELVGTVADCTTLLDLHSGADAVGLQACACDPSAI